MREWKWDTHYIYQKDVLEYLQHVVERHDLRKDIHFETELTGAEWDDTARRWTVTTSIGVRFKARYLVAALGLLSRQNLPDIPGLSSYKGEVYHTGRWPDNVQLEGKRVGVIGNGSTGVQVITEVAPYVKRLVSFQRNPQYSVPSGQGAVSKDYRQEVNKDYPEIWDNARDSLFAFGFHEISDKKTMEVSPEERNRIFEEAWNTGGGFRFMFGTFSDISTDPAANEAACEFIKGKIRQTVKDPEKAEKLMPRQMYARRPLCDAGYYERFNRENVSDVLFMYLRHVLTNSFLGAG